MYQAENDISRPPFQYRKKSCLSYLGSLSKRERLSLALSFPEPYCLEWRYCGMEASYRRAKSLEGACIHHCFMEVIQLSQIFFLDSFIYLSHHWFGSLLISVKPNHNWFNYLLSFLIEPWLYSDTHHPKAKQIIQEKWSYCNELPFYFTVDDFKKNIWHRFGQWHERRSLPEVSWERCSLLLWRHTGKR